MDTRSGYYAMAFALELDRLSLQSRIVTDLLPLQPIESRELFRQIQFPRLTPLSCEEPLSYDPALFYILDGYLKGTKPQLPFRERIEVPPTTTVTGELICVFVRLVIGDGGKDFTDKVILLDQFKRKHPTDEITFTWLGSTERPKFPTVPSSPQDKRSAT